MQIAAAAAAAGDEEFNHVSGLMNVHFCRRSLDSS